MKWWGTLKGTKERPWWIKKYKYDAAWREKLPGIRPGEAIWMSDDSGFIDDMETIWGRPWGAQGELGKLRSVLVARPPKGEVSLEKKDAPELFFLYHSKDGSIWDLEKMREQHDNFVKTLKTEGVDEVIEWDIPDDLSSPYSGITFSSLHSTKMTRVIRGGAILPRYSVSITNTRKGAEVLLYNVLAELGIPTLYTIHGTGSLSGGNWVFLDSHHLCLGDTVTSNKEAINQITPVLKNAGIEEIYTVTLPGSLVNPAWPAHGIMHLDLALGIADVGLAVAYGLPCETLEYLRQKRISLIEPPPEEQRNCACNLFTLRPGKTLIPEGNNRTASALRKEGVDVIELNLSEFAKGGTGPRCMALDLIRDYPDPSLEEIRDRTPFLKLA